MKKIEVKAWAKLNLSLDVTGRRSDGYHEMCMIMQSVGLYDMVTITLTEDGTFSAMTNRRYLPCDERNIAVRAAMAFVRAAGLEGAGVHVAIRKRIPVCAGLGGGSADAAAVLRGLNRLTGAGFSTGQLRALGLPLGADVPFCISGGTMLATGLGENLQKLPPMPDCNVLICKPPFPISTRELFRRLDGLPICHHPDTPGLISALRTGDLPDLARHMFNVFEDALPDRAAAEIRTLRNTLIDCGALGAIMTGTGSAVFGLFDSAQDAKLAQQRLSNECETCYLTRPIGSFS